MLKKPLKPRREIDKAENDIHLSFDTHGVPQTKSNEAWKTKR
jgi:hypothetical protein